MPKDVKAHVILFGIGDIAEVAFEYLRAEHEVIAVTVDEEYIGGRSEWNGLPILPFEKTALDAKISEHGDVDVRLFLPISYRNLNTLREEKYEQARNWGYSFISYVHPSVEVLPSATIGENCMILENNVVQPRVTIGDNTIVWSHCHLGHHSTIGRNCYITSGTVLCGCTEIGDNTFVGAGALIRDNIRIGRKNIIGMGAVITRSTEDGQLYLAGLDNKRELRRPIETVKI
jgi:sugar O-acyltransferase (sialic acid O-acetyltransferase NeuD family)